MIPRTGVLVALVALVVLTASGCSGIQAGLRAISGSAGKAEVRAVANEQSLLNTRMNKQDAELKTLSAEFARTVAALNVARQMLLRNLQHQEGVAALQVEQLKAAFEQSQKQLALLRKMIGEVEAGMAPPAPPTPPTTPTPPTPPAPAAPKPDKSGKPDKPALPPVPPLPAAPK